MRLFGRSEPPKKKRPRKSVAEKEKELDLKRKKVEFDGLMELIKDDPSVKRQLVAETFHLDLKKADPAEEKKRKIEDKITSLAFDRIGQDDELTEDLVKSALESIIGGPRKRRRGDDDGGYQEYSSPISQLLEELDSYEELKERFGGKGDGLLGGIWDPEVTKTLVQTILPLLLSRVQQPGLQSGPAPTIREIPREALQPPPRPVLEQPVAEEIPPPPPPEPAPEPEVEPPAPSTSFVQNYVPDEPEEEGINLIDWIPFLDEEPGAFVTELLEGVALEKPVAKFTADFLRQRTTEAVLEAFQPFKQNEQLGEVIATLEANREWLDGVISGLRMILGEGE